MSANGAELGPRLLIVDDQATSREIVVAICRKLGLVNVDTAKDGAEALEKLRAQTYAIVISDWNMAPVSGLELLRTLRADPRLAKTKFVMMTARTDADAILVAKRFGVDTYLVKPFSPRVLQEKLVAILD
jgi:two-component system, chemotaxis family, chemotaxis protein CheY